MPSASWQFSIEDSPRGAPIEVPGGIVVAIVPPMDDRRVSVTLDPAIHHYEDAPKAPPGIEIRGAVVHGLTNEVVTLEVGPAQAREFLRVSHAYRLQFQGTSPVEFEGQTFRKYDFHLEQLEEDEVPEDLRSGLQFNQASDLASRGDWGGAEAAYSRIIIDPGASPEPRHMAFVNRARTRSQQGALAGAIEDLTAALPHVPPAMAPDVLVARAGYKLRVNDRPGAIQDCDQALSMPGATKAQRKRAEDLRKKASGTTGT